MKIISTAAAAAVFTIATGLTAGPAAASDGAIRYTYADGGYQRVDVDGFGGDGNGLYFGGSLRIHDAAFLRAEYDYADLSRGVDVRTLELAGGVRYPMTSDADAVLQLGYIDGKLDSRFGDFNDDGFFVSGGVRWMLTEIAELNAAVKYVDLDESGDDWSFAFGGLLDVSENLALLGSFEFLENTDVLRVGLRYYF